MFFNRNKNPKLSFAWGGYKFEIKGDYLCYRSVYGKSFRVRSNDIESVSLETQGFGKNKILINGKGTVLASLIIGQSWGEKAQDFIYNEIISKKD